MAVLRVPVELLLITGKAEFVELRAEEERYKIIPLTQIYNCTIRPC